LEQSSTTDKPKRRKPDLSYLKDIRKLTYAAKKISRLKEQPSPNQNKENQKTETKKPVLPKIKIPQLFNLNVNLGTDSNRENLLKQIATESNLSESTNQQPNIDVNTPVVPMPEGKIGFNPYYKNPELRQGRQNNSGKRLEDTGTQFANEIFSNPLEAGINATGNLLDAGATKLKEILPAEVQPKILKDYDNPLDFYVQDAISESVKRENFGQSYLDVAANNFAQGRFLNFLKVIGIDKSKAEQFRDELRNQKLSTGKQLVGELSGLIGTLGAYGTVSKYLADPLTNRIANSTFFKSKLRGFENKFGTIEARKMDLIAKKVIRENITFGAPAVFEGIQDVSSGNMRFNDYIKNIIHSTGLGTAFALNKYDATASVFFQDLNKLLKQDRSIYNAVVNKFQGDYLKTFAKGTAYDAIVPGLTSQALNIATGDEFDAKQLGHDALLFTLFRALKYKKLKPIEAETYGSRERDGSQPTPKQPPDIPPNTAPVPRSSADNYYDVTQKRDIVKSRIEEEATRVDNLIANNPDKEIAEITDPEIINSDIPGINKAVETLNAKIREHNEGIRGIKESKYKNEQLIAVEERISELQNDLTRSSNKAEAKRISERLERLQEQRDFLRSQTNEVKPETDQVTKPIESTVEPEIPVSEQAKTKTKSDEKPVTESKPQQELKENAERKQPEDEIKDDVKDTDVLNSSIPITKQTIRGMYKIPHDWNNNETITWKEFIDNVVNNDFRFHKEETPIYKGENLLPESTKIKYYFTIDNKNKRYIHKDIYDYAIKIYPQYAKRGEPGLTKSNNTQQNTDSKPTVEPEPEVSAEKTRIISVANLHQDPKRFQNRDNAYSESSVYKIVENFDERKLEDIIVWRDPKDGKVYNLSGHSRTEAMKRLGKKTIPAKFFRGTEKEAIDFALNSNNQTPESIIERSNYYRKQRESGTEEKTILKEAKLNEANNYIDIMALSHLNPNGKALDSYKKLSKGSDSNSTMLKNIAVWTGTAREEYPQLTNQHENEIFNFLFDKKNYDAIRNKTNLLDKLGNVVNRLDFNPEEPLNLNNAINKTSFEIEKEKQLQKLQQEKREILSQINERTKILENNGKVDVEIKNDPKIQQLKQVTSRIEKDIINLKNRHSSKEEMLFYGAGTSRSRNAKPERTSTEEPKKNSTESQTETTKDSAERMINDEMGKFERDSSVNPVVKDDFTELDLNNVKNRRDIGMKLAEGIKRERGKDVREGGQIMKRFSRKALGLFFPDSGIVRVRNINDISVLAHELGHHLDYDIFKLQDHVRFKNRDQDVMTVVRGNGFKDPVRREKLLNSYREKFGKDFVDAVLQRVEIRNEIRNISNYAERSAISGKWEEPIAEFIRFYVTAPEFAKNKAPKFYELFEGIIDSQPNIKKALLDAREQYKEFNSQDPRQITESTIQRETEPSFIRGLINKVKNSDPVFNIFDAYKPIEKLAEQLKKIDPNLKGVDNPYLQMLSLLGADGKAQKFLEFGVKDGKGLLPTLNKIVSNNEFKQVEGYLVAKRNLELIERGLKNAATTTKEIAEHTIKEYEKSLGKEKMEGYANAIYEYNNSILDWYYENSNGKLSRENYNKIKDQNQYYVPFKRYFDELDSQGNINFSKILSDTSPSPIKKIKGSEREIVSPLENIIKNTYDVVVSAQRNTVLKTLVESLQKVDPALVQNIPAQTYRPVKVFDKGINILMEDGTLIRRPPKNTFKTEIAVEYKKPDNAEVVTVFENGLPQYYQIPKNYYDSYFAFSEPITWYAKALNIPTRILQAGAVIYDPSFTVSNIFRDQPTALMNSRYGYLPYYDMFKGLFSTLKKDDIYQKFMESGADQSFLTAMDQMLSKSYLNRKQGKDVEGVTNNFKGYLKKYAKNPIELLQDMNRLSELATRVGAFKKAYQKTGDIYLAMEEGRQISGDYGVKGKNMRNVSLAYAFLNPRLQHLKLTGQVASGKRGNLGSKFLMGALFMSLPAIINWFANNSDKESRDRYDELPDWRKYGFFNIPIPGSDSYILILKGFYGTLFGTSVEKMLDWIYGNDPDTVTKLGQHLFQEVSPFTSPIDFAPTAFRPAAEQYANKKSFTGTPIIPERMEDTEPSEQYTDWTPEIYKTLGKHLNISPLRIETLVNSYTGGTGRNIANISDEIMESLGMIEDNDNTKFRVLGVDLTQMPVTKRFLSENPLGTRGSSVQNFYEKLDELEGLNKTVNKLIKEDNDVRLAEYLSKNDREADYKFYLNNTKSFGQFKEFLRSTNDLRKLLKDDREKINELNKRVTDIAKKFKESYENKSKFSIDKEIENELKKIKDKKKESRENIKEFKSKYKEGIK